MSILRSKKEKINLSKTKRTYLSFKLLTQLKKEATWHMDKVVDMAVRERCTRRHAQNVKKSAKSLLSRAATVRYTAGNAFQSARTKGVKRRDYVGLLRIQPVAKLIHQEEWFGHLFVHHK